MKTTNAQHTLFFAKALARRLGLNVKEGTGIGYCQIIANSWTIVIEEDRTWEIKKFSAKGIVQVRGDCTSIPRALRDIYLFMDDMLPLDFRVVNTRLTHFSKKLANSLDFKYHPSQLEKGLHYVGSPTWLIRLTTPNLEKGGPARWILNPRDMTRDILGSGDVISTDDLIDKIGALLPVGTL